MIYWLCPSFWWEMIGFKGGHVDKMIVSYKNEGYGFQADALCDRGYTYTFSWIIKVFQRNKRWWGFHLCMLVYLLHFYHFEINFIVFTLEISTWAQCVCTFYRTHHNCVKVQGICQTCGWIIQREVLQTKLNYEKETYRVWQLYLSNICYTYLSPINQFINILFLLLL